MKNLVRYMIGVLSVVPMWSMAFIYDIQVLRKWDKARKRYHYFIGCSDFHDKKHQVTKSQRKDIDTFISNLDVRNTKVILEDLSSKNTQNRRACGRFMVNSRGGILGGLSGKCHDLGLEVANVEFRYCRVTSLGPVLNNLRKDFRDFPSVRETKVATMIKEIDGVVQEIRKYDDEIGLKRQYDSLLRKVLPEVKALHMRRHPNHTIAQYLAAHSKDKTRLGLLKRLFTFDSALLDARLAHEVHNARNKKYAIAFAGGAHINKVGQMLKNIGYERVHSTKVTYERERDIKRCLGSNVVSGSYCVKPQPISLDVLDTFIKE